MLDLFSTDNVKYTQTSKTLRSILQYYKQPPTVKPVFKYNLAKYIYSVFY